MKQERSPLLILCRLLIISVITIPQSGFTLEPTLQTKPQQGALRQQPNILLLVAEDLSPRIGAFGDQLAKTPNLDSLAAKSITYTRAFTTAGVCAPSRAALITGQHQISFGAQHMRTTTGPLGKYFAQPPLKLRAFPELLRRDGYYTYTDNKLDYQFSGIRAGSGPFSLWDKDGAKDTQWRERKSGQPFFALINFLETHESGVMRPAGPPHSKSHAQTQQMRSRGGLIAAKVTDPADIILPPYYPDLPQVREDIARHYDNIHKMDQRVGHILQQLSADKLLENTIIIWTADHGDGLPRAKRELFDSGLHVPLIVHIPPSLQKIVGGSQTGSEENLHPGDKNPRLISFVDLAPTILNFAGVVPPDYLHGRSIFSQERTHIFASRDRIDEVMDRQRAVRSQQFKYIRSWYPAIPGGHTLAYRDNLDMVRAMRHAYEEGQLNHYQRRWFEATPREQLYDTQADPYELNNLVDDDRFAAQLHAHRLKLDDFLQRSGDTGAKSEQALRAQLLENNKIPVTPPPQIHKTDMGIVLAHPLGVSMGYRYSGEESWRLYTQPIPNINEISGFSPKPVHQALEAKAIRYGWHPSKVVKFVGQP